jgi:hypothetical protein
MMAGHSAVPDVGYYLDTEKETDLPPPWTVILSELNAKDAVTDDGVGGIGPSS